MEYEAGHWETVVVKSREFKIIRPDGTKDISCGFGFPVNEKGEVVFDNPEAEANFRMCVAHPEQYADEGIVETERSFFVEPTMRCRCGHKITLHDSYYGADSCPYCGQWHNLFGEELLPPNQWEMD